MQYSKELEWVWEFRFVRQTFTPYVTWLDVFQLRNEKKLKGKADLYVVAMLSKTISKMKTLLFIFIPVFVKYYNASSGRVQIFPLEDLI